MKRKFKKSEGITLMVLILMIVITLILLSVGAKVIIDGKLITNTEKTVNGTNNKIAQEQLEIDEMMGILTEVDQKTCTHQWGEWKTVREPTCLVEGKKYRMCNLCGKIEYGKIATVAHTIEDNKQCTTCSLKIGDYVNYKTAGTPYETSYLISKDYSGTTEDQTAYLQEIKWVVVNIEEDGLELAPDNITYIGNVADNTVGLKLRGAQGYNNGVEILNDMCNKLYGTGEYATSARSVKIEDISEKSGSETQESYEDGKYPARWVEEEGAIIDGKSTGGTLKKSDIGSKLIENKEGEAWLQTDASITFTTTLWQGGKDDTFKKSGKAIMYHATRGYCWCASRAMVAKDNNYGGMFYYFIVSRSFITRKLSLYSWRCGI